MGLTTVGLNSGVVFIPSGPDSVFVLLNTICRDTICYRIPRAKSSHGLG